MKNRTNNILAVGICMAFGVVTTANAKPPVDDLEETLNTKISELEARVVTLEANEVLLCPLYQAIVESPIQSFLDIADIPEFCAEHLELKRIFITSKSWTGNLGGITGADRKCQAAADDAELPGKYKAWLATSATDAPVFRFTHSITRYVLNDNQSPELSTTVANDWSDLVDGNDLQTRINVNEYGVTIPGVSVWSNVTGSGDVFDTIHCDDWSNGSDGNGNTGFPTYRSIQWTLDVPYSCNNVYHLYCFQQ